MKLSSFDRLKHPGQVFLGLGLVLALVVGYTAAPVVGGEPSSNNGDRGENPVVGSLPCMVDDNLDIIFWDGMGEEEPGFLPAAYPATLALCSDDIRGDVLDAWGEPYGRLNDRWDWRCLGLQKEARVTAPSALFETGAMSSWFWVPPGYHGGELKMDGPLGTKRVKLGRNARELPMAELVAASGNAVTISNFVATAPVGSGLPTIQMRVTVLGPVTFVEYL